MQQSKRNIVAENRIWLKVKVPSISKPTPSFLPTHPTFQKICRIPTRIHINYPRPHHYPPLHTHIPIPPVSHTL